METPSVTVGRTPVRVENDRVLGERMKKQRGATAIEMVVFIFVSLLLLIAAMVWWPKLTGSANNQGELENITSVITNIRTIKTASGYGPSGTNLLPVLINSDGIPETMQKSGTAVFNVWGGAVTAVSTGTGYTLTYADVPTSSCIFLASKSPSNNAMSLKLNGGQALSGEVSAIAANAGCNSDSNTLAWSGR